MESKLALFVQFMYGDINYLTSCEKNIAVSLITVVPFDTLKKWHKMAFLFL